ncbi:MAG: hypothetical protein C0610_16655 [Desulfobacteraceae bacterium]|nr:MAG: hypothetical protein C0610_16655 [Desulfobacteraceae bacterium]
MRTYYDALFTGLVPVKLVKRVGYMVTVEVTETVKAYKKGEVMEIFARDFVRKVRVNGDGFQMIATVGDHQ